MKARQLLVDNLAAARGSRDDNDSLAGLIVTFFIGICLEQNLGPDRTQITKKIEAFMQLIRERNECAFDEVAGKRHETRPKQ
jgi:hypothetical protein